MTDIILGLDIGGANLKAATSDGRAVSVPFAVWKHPERLGDELAKLIGQFPEAKSLAVTMTAELCDCYETKRKGVNKILDAVAFAASVKPFVVWSTAGCFVVESEARVKHMAVAAANWHALATFAGRFVPDGDALLIDIGTTTSDLIPLLQGKPNTMGLTDHQRLAFSELIYSGWKRTPATSFLGTYESATEFFATVQDAHIVLGHIKADSRDLETADGRPATKKNAAARLARMRCADAEDLYDSEIKEIARGISQQQSFRLHRCIKSMQLRIGETRAGNCKLILSGSGTFIAEIAINETNELLTEKLYQFGGIRYLSDLIGPMLAETAPAYAVAVIAAEARA